MNARLEAQVAIVGAGYAGLVAARELTKRGIDVIVLEARDLVGGRVWTQQRDGYWVDVGGQWTGPGQDRIRALGDEMGVPSFPTWPDGEHIQYTGGMDLRRWTGAAPDEDIETMGEVVQAIIAFDQLAQEVPLGAPWEATRAREWDGMTVQTWIDQNIDSERAREQMATAIEAVFVAEPHDVSLLHALFYARSGQGLSTSCPRKAAPRPTASTAAPNSPPSVLPPNSAIACVSTPRFAASSRTAAASPSRATTTPSRRNSASSPRRLRSPVASTTIRLCRRCAIN